MEGSLQRIDMFGNTFVGRWKVWSEAGDQFIEVACGGERQAALLTMRDESGCAYKKEAWRIFNRMTGAGDGWEETATAG
jgi:hypothetical protein